MWSRLPPKGQSFNLFTQLMSFCEFPQSQQFSHPTLESCHGQVFLVPLISIHAAWSPMTYVHLRYVSPFFFSSNIEIETGSFIFVTFHRPSHLFSVSSQHYQVIRIRQWNHDEIQEIHSSTRKNFLILGLEQAAQRGCRGCIPGDVQNPPGHHPEEIILTESA